MNAVELKDVLRRRYPATQYMGTLEVPGAWTCLEEWEGVDLLAIGATAGADGFAWIGHEVKVSRGDLRSELLNPSKREAYKSACQQLYLAVPAGLLTREELAFEEPDDWTPADYERTECPRCENDRPRRDTRETYGWAPRGSLERVPVPVDESGNRRWESRWTKIPCRACRGKGYASRSRVEREAPTLWVPRDLGLIEVRSTGTRLVREAPRHEMPHPSAATLGRLVRWASARPDPRHAGVVEAARVQQRSAA